MKRRDRIINLFKKRVTSTGAIPVHKIERAAYQKKNFMKEISDADAHSPLRNETLSHNNFYRKVKPMLLLVVVLLISWCSNYDQMTQQRIQELEKEANVAQVACSNLQVINSKINSLKGYITPDTTSNAQNQEKDNDSKPLLEGYICLVNDKGETEYKEFTKDQVEYVKDCWAFAWKSECRIAGELNCLKKE